MKKIKMLTALGALIMVLSVTGCTGNNKNTVGEDAAESTPSVSDNTDSITDSSETAFQPETTMTEFLIITGPSAPPNIDTDESKVAASTATPAGRNATLTKETYDNITIGMKYEAVVDLLGTEGNLVSQTDTDGIKTDMYTWTASGSDAVYTSINFADDIVIAKQQTGVYEKPEANIDREKYDKIKTEMTYAEVTGIIGGDGELSSESEHEGLNIKIYNWYTEDNLGHASITVSGDVVISKAEIGLPPA